MNEFWHGRWAEGRIGWHEPGGNTALKKHWTASGKRVLVPLCGKSADLLWLAAQDNEVVGVEFSPIAVAAFFADNGLEFDHTDNVYRAIDVNVTIHLTDYFDFDDGPFDAIYDRAALIAMPPSVRPDYVHKTNTLLAPDPCQLLVTLEYDQSLAEGPPYSVSGDEVLSYWPMLECLETREDLANAAPKFHEAGVTEMFEVVWRSRDVARPGC